MGTYLDYNGLVTYDSNIKNWVDNSSVVSILSKVIEDQQNTISELTQQFTDCDESYYKQIMAIIG